MITSEGSVEMPYHTSGVIEYTFKSELTAKPGKLKQSIRYFWTIGGDTQPYTSVQTVFNGDGHLVRDGKGQFLKDQALKELKAQAYQREVCLLTPLLKDSKFNLTVLDNEAQVSGKAAVALMVHHADYQDIVLYFDKESGRLVKSKRSFYHFGYGKGGELLTVFSNFKTVAGAVIPHQAVSYNDGKLLPLDRITSVLVLASAPDEWFRIQEEGPSGIAPAVR